MLQNISFLPCLVILAEMLLCSFECLTFLNNCVMFCIEIVFVGKDSKKLFIVRMPDGRPVLSSFDIAEASAYIDDHSNMPKSQDNKSAD